MIPLSVAVVARADTSRAHLATYLRDAGYEVFACEDLAIPTRFAVVVTIDGQEPPVEFLRERVTSWLKLKRTRVVVISFKPATWKALVLAHRDRLFVFPAPACGWEIVDALRGGRSPESPRSA